VEEPRRRGRYDEVADEPGHVRDEHSVAERRVEAPVAKVDPRESEDEQHELGEPVDRACRRRERADAPDAVLQVRLEERVHVTLRVEDRAAVRERRRAIVAGDAANRLVREAEADPHRDLGEEVAETVRPKLLQLPPEFHTRRLSGRRGRKTTGATRP
jgi:hypothetical protein